MTETVHKRIERLMAERGLAMKELSRAAGLNETTLRSILRRETSMRLASLEGIADALDIELGHLISDVSDFSAEEAELIRVMRHMSDDERSLVQAMVDKLSSARRKTGS